MTVLVDEVQQWNTPAIGAFLLWNFTKGYYHAKGDAPVALLHFMALPILTNKDLIAPVNNHRSNLQSYVRHFENNKESDILLTIHERASTSRHHTLSSINIAISTGLLVWDVEDGKLYARETVKRAGKGKGLKQSYKTIGNKSELLGKWFAEHSTATIATYLKVVL